MSNNEIITLSSDEEEENKNSMQTEKRTLSNIDINFSGQILNNVPKPNENTKNNYPLYKYHVINNDKNKNCSIDKEAINEATSKHDSSTSSPELVELSPDDVKRPLKNVTEEKEDPSTSRLKVAVSSNNCSNVNKLNSNTSVEISEIKSTFPDDDQEKTDIYDKFVNKCVSLEPIEKDKERLKKKLYKYYSNSNPEYVKSEKFLIVVEKNMKKLNEQNLYLIAKEVTDELCLQRELEIRTSWFGKNKNSSENENYDKNNKLSLKQSKCVNKILWKLSQLQKKIQELEETEVDLSDEEDSVYVRLQSYRNKFCQIYKRLCKCTNQVADANRMCSRNISFNGSPYLEINQSIEKWLNKNKTFPDFKDIFKIIENQSFSLGLPSNRDSLREIAEEIFQKVGIQLKERRKYDLWDSFCGYLKDSEDPALNNPELEKILNENFSKGRKKEQEIFKYYAEVQEKEKLEPEEISDREANLSPNDDSGNDDDNEIEAIENSIDQKLYNDIEKELEHNLFQSETEEKEEKVLGQHEEMKEIKIRESKNNFQNCKSLKWRKENKNIVNFENKETGSSNLSTNDDEENEYDIEKSVSDCDSEKSQNSKSVPPLIDFSKRPVIQLKRLSENTIEIYSKSKKESNENIKIFNPYSVSYNNEVPVKKLKIDDYDSELNLDNLEEKNSKGLNFVDYYCHVEHDFRRIFSHLNYFDDFLKDQKNLNYGKVFRDLTNTNNLLNCNKKKKKTRSLLFPTIYKCSINSVQKPFWKKRFKVFKSFSNLKEQRCALNQEGKTKTTVTGNGGADKKEMQNNSETGETGSCNFRSNRGSGGEGDNNENDENKKNYKTEDDSDENKYEDEEEKDDEEEETKEFENNLNETVTVEENQNIEISKEISNYENQTCESSYTQNNGIELTQEIEEKRNNNENILKNNEIDITETNKFELTYKKNNENEGNISFDVEQNEKENTKKKQCDNPLNKPFLSHESNKDNEIVDEKVIENKQYCTGKVKEKKQLKHKEKIKDEESEKIPPENVMLTKDNHEVTNEKRKDVDLKEKGESAPQTKKRKRSKTMPITPLNKLKGNSKYFSEENKRITRLSRNKDRAKKTETTNEIINYNTYGRNYEALITAEATIGEQVVQAQVTLKEESTNCHRISNNKRQTNIIGNFSSKKMEVETIRQNLFKRKSTNSAPSPSDEERVKQFLLHSPSSISITPPKKLSLGKPPSQAALQALATLRNLKGISTTRVRTKTKTEDDIHVVGESKRTNTTSAQSLQYNMNGVNLPKKKRNNSFPIISNVQSMQSVTPKIIGIQGSVSGFENSPQKKSKNKNQNNEASNSSIRISNVWSSSPNNCIRVPSQNEAIPSCSYPPKQPNTSKTSNKKTNSKTVEYVELD